MNLQDWQLYADMCIDVECNLLSGIHGENIEA